ncbi:MAG: CBS domain-containing protein [Candidatus Aenigmarchaeota archaeon]|nr:CBS domain-containing protein [Candidatus Aenigmarchaeota archaeon]
MKVKKVMNKNIKTITPDETIQNAAKVMNKYHIGSLVIVSGIMLSGIITERDILKAFAAQKPSTTKVSDIMTGYAVTIEPDATTEEAAALMVKNKIKHLPVVKDMRAVGMVAMTDLVSEGGTMIKKLAPLLKRKIKDGKE